MFRFSADLHLTWDRTKAIAAAASNTWGLFVLVLMLGYNMWYELTVIERSSLSLLL